MGTPAAQIVGLAPVTFVSEDGATAGTQYQLPLPTLKYDTLKGKIDPTSWVPAKGKKLSANDAKLLDIVLANLLTRGTLSVLPPP